MDDASKQNLYAICSYLETFSPKFVDDLVDSFYQVQETMIGNGNKNPEDALEPWKYEMKSKLFSFLKNKSEEEKYVGFDFSVKHFEKENLIKEAIKEVQKKSLLRRTLACLDQTDDLPLNEEEKITFVLSCLNRIPPMHHQIDARLLLPVLNQETGKKGTKTLPVKVVVAENKIVDIALNEEKMYKIQ